MRRSPAGHSRARGREAAHRPLEPRARTPPAQTTTHPPPVPVPVAFQRRRFHSSLRSFHPFVSPFRVFISVTVSMCCDASWCHHEFAPAVSSATATRSGFSVFPTGPRAAAQNDLSGIPEIIFLHFLPINVICPVVLRAHKSLRAASAPVPRLTQNDLQSAAFSCVKLEEFLADPGGMCRL